MEVLGSLSVKSLTLRLAKFSDTGFVFRFLATAADSNSFKAFVGASIQLESLDLWGCSLSDESLEALTKFQKGLRHLELVCLLSAILNSRGCLGSVLARLCQLRTSQSCDPSF